MGYAQNTLCEMPIMTQDISGVKDIVRHIAECILLIVMQLKVANNAGGTTKDR